VSVRLGVGNFPTLILLHTQIQTHSKRIHSWMRFFITANPKITESFVCKEQNQCECEIGCGKFSYTDFTSHSNSNSLYLKPGFYLGFFISTIGR
jgi:hypothetical protein